MTARDSEADRATARPDPDPAPDAAPQGDAVPQAEPVPDPEQAADVVAAAVRRGVARILQNDPLVRLGRPLPDGDTPVHQMRVGCRRLRSDLRTFATLLRPAATAELRTELAWLAEMLGAARDAEVLRARLHRAAGADPMAVLDAVAVDRLDSLLADREEAALTAIDAAMHGNRYTALVELLTAAATAPALSRAAYGPAATVLPPLVAKPWRRLVRGDREAPGAGALARDDPDQQWHAVRIRAKRARYAVEAVAEAVTGEPGGPARPLGRALAEVQDLLGEHQDAVLAGQTWLDLARSAPALGVTCGRLFERERAAAIRLRDRWPAVWQSCARPELSAWLHPPAP